MHLHSAVCTYQSNISFLDASGWVSHTKHMDVSTVQTCAGKSWQQSLVCGWSNKWISGQEWQRLYSIKWHQCCSNCKFWRGSDQWWISFWLSLAEFVVGKLQLKFFFASTNFCTIPIYIFNTCKHSCPLYLHIFIYHYLEIMDLVITRTIAICI